MAVPVLVKDGKPISSTSDIHESHHHHANVTNGTDGGLSGGGGGAAAALKSEYILPSPSSVVCSTTATADLAVPPPPPLPTLMHMGYSGHRHHQAMMEHPNQGGMCTYLPHRAAWQ